VNVRDVVDEGKRVEGMAGILNRQIHRLGVVGAGKVEERRAGEVGDADLCAQREVVEGRARARPG